MTTKFFILLIAIILFIFVFSNARIYHGQNSGIAWDIGGIELKGSPGIFICANNYNPHTGTHWHNPLSDWFPNLITDC